MMMGECGNDCNNKNGASDGVMVVILIIMKMLETIIPTNYFSSIKI